MKWYLIESTNRKLDAEYRQRINDIQSYIKSIAPKRKEIFKKLCKIVKIGTSAKNKERLEFFCKAYRYMTFYKNVLPKLSRYLSGEETDMFLNMDLFHDSGIYEITMGGLINTTNVYRHDGNWNKPLDCLGFNVKTRKFNAELTPIQALEMADWDRKEANRQIELGTITPDDCLKNLVVSKYTLKLLEKSADASIDYYEHLIQDFDEKFNGISAIVNDIATIKKEITKFFGNIDSVDDERLNYYEMIIKHPHNSKTKHGYDLSPYGHPTVIAEKEEQINKIRDWWKSLRSKLSSSYVLFLGYLAYGDGIVLVLEHTDVDGEHKFKLKNW